MKKIEKIEKIIIMLKKIKKDRLALEKKGDLTERGKGHLDIVRLIEEELKK